MCILEKLYGDYCIRKRKNANVKCGVKKFKGLYYKAFWSPEFIKHKQNRQKGQSPYFIEIQERIKNVLLVVQFLVFYHNR